MNGWRICRGGDLNNGFKKPQERRKGHLKNRMGRRKGAFKEPQGRR
jgi:hypothetical protein